MRRAVLSWSSGKDGAFALHRARQEGALEIVGLLTTVSEAYDRVAIHGVRCEILRAQAEALGLPLLEVPLPTPCPNAVYEARMAAALARLAAEGIEEVVFGDIHLADLRAYREAQLARAGLAGHFPLWGCETAALARDVLAAGMVAHLASLDPGRLDRALVGARFDGQLIAALPEGVDPCGEGGEFHTLVSNGPGFTRAVPVVPGEVVEREGFVYADFRLDGAG